MHPPTIDSNLFLLGQYLNSLEAYNAYLACLLLFQSGAVLMGRVGNNQGSGKKLKSIIFCTHTEQQSVLQ